jgi:hypothetical protein
MTSDHDLEGTIAGPTGASAGTKWLVRLLLATLPVGLGFLAARLGSDHWLWRGGAILCGLALLGCFYAVKEDFGSMTGPDDWLAVGYIILVSAVWFLAGLSHTQSAVYVENGTAKTLVVELDGRPWLTVPPSESIKTRLPRKPYQLVVRSEDGTQLDARTLAVGPKKAYVLNLLGARTYHRGWVEYGKPILPFGFGPSAHDIKDVWVEADVDYLFKEPPSSVSVPKSRSWASRSYLLRGPAPKDTKRE